jgi:hypothetical protein
MSRYDKIDMEIIEMKELIEALNKRFDQIYKKIDQLEEADAKIMGKLDKIINHLGIK